MAGLSSGILRRCREIAHDLFQGQPVADYLWHVDVERDDAARFRYLVPHAIDAGLYQLL